MDLSTMLWIMGFIIFGMVGLFVGVIIYNVRVYRFRIRLYKNIGNGWQEHPKIYRARKLQIPGSVGESVLWVPKEKKYISAYGDLSGRNLYYYAEGPDGYWYNIKLGDIDAKMGILDIEVVNRDVRAFHTTNAKNIKDRYNAPKQWPMILMTFSVILALVITFAGGYFMYKQVNEMQLTSGDSLRVAKEVATSSLATTEAQEKLITRLDLILSKLNVTLNPGTTGIRPA